MKGRFAGGCSALPWTGGIKCFSCSGAAKSWVQGGGPTGRFRLGGVQTSRVIRGESVRGSQRTDSEGTQWAARACLVGRSDPRAGTGEPGSRRESPGPRGLKEAAH